MCIDKMKQAKNIANKALILLIALVTHVHGRKIIIRIRNVHMNSFVWPKFTCLIP